MDDRQALARALLSNGMAGQAVDMSKLSDQYDRMVMDGNAPELPKPVWIQQQIKQLQQPQQTPPQQPQVPMPQMPNIGGGY